MLALPLSLEGCEQARSDIIALVAVRGRHGIEEALGFLVVLFLLDQHSDALLMYRLVVENFM